MLRGALRTARYARSWSAGADVTVHETSIRRDGTEIPATLLMPHACRAPLPAWVAVGGVSLMGRFHPQLVRFARALASSGSVVVVPEVPEWRRLLVTPTPVAPTIRGCVDLLRQRPEVRPGKVGVIGFSFGAPSVALAASQDGLAEQIAGIVMFGGYCSLERTLTCFLTGTHDWDGIDYQLSPDPYGRWVLGSNHLTSVPGHEGAGDVSRALHALAEAASGERISAWEAHHDKLIGELRAGIARERRPLFDCFARPSGAPEPDIEECRRLAKDLAGACRRWEPLLEPSKDLARIEVPVQVIHGRGDRLVPFTEGLRLMEGFPERMRRGATVTRLINHSKDETLETLPDQIVERAALFGALRRLINTV
jgi:pimeloyl-ACP methyl ester carboxylesterase